MTTTSTLTVSCTLAALLVFAAPVQAEQHELGEEEVRAYFEQLRQEVMEIVQSEAFNRIDQMTERHLGEGAVFSVTGEMMKDDRRKTFMAATLERADLVAMKHRAAAMLQGVDIADYSLEVEVAEVHPHGESAATVTATWTDRGALSRGAPTAPGAAASETGARPAPQPGQQDARQEATTGTTAGETTPALTPEGNEQQPEAGALSFERTFTCHHLVQREGEQLKIGLTTCQGQVRL